jgi:hypothetical protein
MQKKHGIKIEGMWVSEDGTQFIWIRSFANPEDVKAKEAAFYGSPEWNSVMPTLTQRRIIFFEFTTISTFPLRGEGQSSPPDAGHTANPGLYLDHAKRLSAFGQGGQTVYKHDVIRAW